jgi:hypothetical protein
MYSAKDAFLPKISYAGEDIIGKKEIEDFVKLLKDLQQKNLLKKKEVKMKTVGKQKIKKEREEMMNEKLKDLGRNIKLLPSLILFWLIIVCYRHSIEDRE